VFNISAMSFGALSANAILALNAGAKRGGFAHDTGEGSISQHHRVHGGDLIWEIGSGYFGCRNDDGSFSEERFAANANDPQVKMIELKLSQGAKPGHGGVLPGPKVTPEIAAGARRAGGRGLRLAGAHSAFSYTPLEMMQFIERLRELSGGKPTGFKLCIGHPWEWFGIVKAMLETGITPDFIVVDGAEGGTGAAPLEFTDHVGAPLQEGLLLVHNTLGRGPARPHQAGLRGQGGHAFDIARMMALGADWCNAARGFMFALGCIQAQTCHTGHCPTGVTTQDPLRQQALVVPDKAERVYQFHRNTLHALKELVQAAGLTHPNDITAHHIVRRLDDTEVRLLANLLPQVTPGALLDFAMLSTARPCSAARRRGPRPGR
jgi:glutamate synthase domain-containing protein 2